MANERDGAPGTHLDPRLAMALGWFSLGFGIAGVAAPAELARLIGAGEDRRTRDLLRTVGMREIITGLGILTQPKPQGWLWSRVAGDVMDLAMLASAWSSGEGERDRLCAAAAAVAGVTAVDLYASRQSGGNGKQSVLGANNRAHQDQWSGPRRYARGTTIYRSPEEVYAFWRDLENLPHFMRFVEEVQIADERRSRWRVAGPAGISVEWEAEIVEERPGRLIRWRTLPDADVAHSGWVTFDPGPRDQGTEVRVELEYCPPGGGLGDRLAQWLNKDPGQELKEDLRRLKQVLETGEVVRSESSQYGNSFPQRAARPLPPRELRTHP